MTTIIGTPVSPYVRKILAILTLKKIAFEIDPITPFFGGDDFVEISPLRRIPVLIERGHVFNDSSVIAQYLEETRPEAPILPSTPEARAQARWLEEFADTRMGDVFIWKGFGAMVVAPAVFGTPCDLDAFTSLLETDVAEVMDYLESVTPADRFLCGEFGLADIAVAVMFRNMRYARWTPDAARWPKTVAWLARAEAQPALKAPTAWADALARTVPHEHRRKATELGLAVTSKTHFVETPRRGPMTEIG